MGVVPSVLHLQFGCNYCDFIFLLLLDMLKDPAYINSYRINNAEHAPDSTSWNDDNYRLLHDRQISDRPKMI